MTPKTPNHPDGPSFPANNKLYALDAYGYELPKELIAQHPLAERDHARLMVIDRGTGMIRHDIFKNVGQYLPKQSMMVINNSKVIPARLLGRKERTQGAVEVFLLKSLPDGHSFEALLKPLKKINEGDVLIFEGGLRAVLADKEKRIVRFDVANAIERLQQSGHMPLPPYIQRSDTAADKVDYQTVYAQAPGSVAAPTAGLHFTVPLMDRLKAQGHAFNELTLHINYGTFKPVETPDIREHPMHAEWYALDPQVHDHLAQAKSQGRPVVAVGTTSCRVLEAVGQTQCLAGETRMFIYPGYTFTMVDALITNFHLPQSTLLMLVCAFGGYDLIMKAYAEAVKERYRFYSYGDAMIII